VGNILIKQVFEGKPSLDFGREYYRIDLVDKWSKNIWNTMMEAGVNYKFYSEYSITEPGGRYWMLSERKVKGFKINLYNLAVNANINRLICYYPETGDPKIDKKKNYIVVPLHIKADLDGPTVSNIRIYEWAWGAWNGSEDKKTASEYLNEICF
jgi:hypothetical protein